jgi:tRNA nucleotidyltransferase/poly(A) polymerase
VELNMVTTQLQLMRQHLLPFMDALFKGAPEEQQERNIRLAELERIGNSLRLILRDIQNEQNRLDAMQRNLGNVPRDNRWSANQSLNQQQTNLQNARKQAEDLAEAVRQLMNKNGLLSPLQMSMKLKDLLENIEKSVDQGQAVHQIMSELGVPSITQPHAEQPAVSSLIPVIVFIIYGLRRITGKTAVPQAPQEFNSCRS